MSGSIEILARTPLPTAHGEFVCIAFRDAAEPEATHIALVRGEPDKAESPPVRVHSECFTGEVLHSAKCDCRHQLDAALEHIARYGTGVLVYLRQEGRGIGLVEKLKAYALQEAEGLDTVDANRRLGLPDDARRYDAAAALLETLGVRSVVLLTNNPSKVEGLEKAGVEVVGRVPILAATTEQARAYLATKIARMGHLVEKGPTGGAQASAGPAAPEDGTGRTGT
jgi:GTP cyclohydrolase II